jgi:hypothetical protein
MTSDELEEWRQANGYVLARQLDDGRLVAIGAQTFGKWRINIGDTVGVHEAY